MPRRDYDPLALIPSSDTVRAKLARLQEQCRKLGILLRTAQELEGVESPDDLEADTSRLKQSH